MEFGYKIGFLLTGVGVIFGAHGAIQGDWQNVPFSMILAGIGATVLLLVHAVGRRRKRVADTAVTWYGPPPVSWSAEGHPAAQQFRVQNPVAAFLKANWYWFLPQLMVFFLLVTVLGSVPFGEDGLLPGIAVGLAATAAMVAVIARKHRRRGVLAMVIRMSPMGVEMWDYLGYSTHLRWQDITRVGRVTGPWRTTGLIGWGGMSIPDIGSPSDTAEPWIRERLAAQSRDPRSGAIEVAIGLGVLDRNWQVGPMGDWVRRYRPDLLAAVPEQPTVANGHDRSARRPGEPQLRAAAQPPTSTSKVELLEATRPVFRLKAGMGKETVIGLLGGNYLSMNSDQAHQRHAELIKLGHVVICDCDDSPPTEWWLYSDVPKGHYIEIVFQSGTLVSAEVKKRNADRRETLLARIDVEGLAAAAPYRAALGAKEL